MSEELSFPINALSEERTLAEVILNDTARASSSTRYPSANGLNGSTSWGTNTRHKRRNTTMSRPRFPRYSHRADSVSVVDVEQHAASSTRQLGAALPGSDLGEPDDDFELFAKMIEGRGPLPNAEPTSTFNWQTSKWKVQLEFLPFNPTNEIELEDWFEDAAFKIMAHGAKASTVIKVMQLVAPPSIRLILNACLRECEKFTQIEEIADSIAKRLFRGDKVLETFERELFQQNPKPSVFTAFAAYRRIEEIYIYLCRRRARHVAIGSQQSTTIVMSLLPRSVAKHVKRSNPSKKWEPLKLFAFALDMENSLDSEDSVAFAEEGREEVYPAMDTSTGELQCSGCNGNHLRRNCPHKKDRCLKCGYIGHISVACRSKVIYDTAGVRRMVAQPTQGGVNLETILDNTTPAQLRSVAGVVDKLVSNTDKERERARAKYAQRKQQTHPNAPVRPQQTREVLNTQSQSHWNDTVINSNDEDCGLCEVQEIYNVEEDIENIAIPKKRRLMNVRMLINNLPTIACVDTGATINCMSLSTASEMLIKEDTKQLKTQIKNVHQEVRSSPISEEVDISLDGNCKCSARFALLNEPVRTIISLPTLNDLKCTLNIPANTISANGITYQCLNAEQETDLQQAPMASTLQQTTYGEIDVVLKEEEKNWDARLSPTERNQALDLLKGYQDTWYAPKIGKCTTVTMEIHVSGKPRRVTARPTPVHLRNELNRQIDDLLAAGAIISTPDCKWVSACHLVPKPRSDKWRLVIDYRYVNTLVEDDGYQIPNMQDLITRLTGSKIFSLIDLNWGFWNVSLDETSRQYTGFVVPERGVFVWTVMPFGLKISPTIFQRAIEMALRTLIDQGHVSVYIDDIIIYTDTVDEHLRIMKQIFQLLRECGFYVNLPKARLFRSEVLYLGHIISEHQVKPDPAKIKAIAEAIDPKDKRTLLSFCAAANYLRAYIPRFSELMEPLTRLTGKYVRFEWGEEQHASFQLAKNEIMNACYLTMPRWDRPFVIFTDASDVAVAAALTQVGENDDSIEFISFGSKKLTTTQRNWSPTERELYAIVWACEHFEQYIKGTKPLIYSDHASLEHLLNFESPKVKRWAIRLSEFNPHVTHIGGDQNNVADWLSRSVPLDDDEDVSEVVYVPTVLHLVHTNDDEFKLPDPLEMTSEAKAEEVEMSAGTLDWYGGIAYGRSSRRMYIPKKYRMQLLLWFHTSRYGGHQGVTRTTNRLRKFVWWPNLQLSVVDFINSCPVCNAIKPLRGTGGETGALNRSNLFDMVSIDFIGPRRRFSRSYYIMIIVDHYSRYMVAVVTDSIATPQPANILRDHWVAKFGKPNAILADRDPVLKAVEFTSYVRKELGSKLFFTSSEYPQGNGINESSHRILETAIKTHFATDETTVETLVADAALLHNVTPNRRIGDTPSSLIFGCDLHIPGLENYEPEMTEASRLTCIRNYRGHRYLIKQLNEIEEFAPQRKDRAATVIYKVGDIVTYRLSKSEATDGQHYSNESKFTASRSFPHRVVRVTPKDLIMIPIWTEGGERSAPKEQCKLIATFIPELMREEVQQLYPKMPWLSTSTDTFHETTSNETIQQPNEHKKSEDENKTPTSRKRRRTARAPTSRE